jgi:uncharacterized Tic20 family protein
MSDAFTANVPAPLPEPTQDERTMATLAHVLQLVGGWIAPLIIFFVKADSKFVRFHSLQALLLQALHFLTIFFAMIFFFIVMFASVLGTAAAGNKNAAPPVGIFLMFPFLWLFIMAWWVFTVVLAIVYAIKAGRGEWAEYPLLGRWAKRILKIA